MGDKGQGAASQLLRLSHPGLNHQGRQLQRGGDLRAVQEPPAHGKLLCAVLFYSKQTHMQNKAYFHKVLVDVYTLNLSLRPLVLK